jgi:phosphatidylglycerophosphate synthase
MEYLAMFDNTLRPLKDRLTSPLADAVGRRLAPDTVSWLAFVAGLGCAASLGLGYHWLALALWLLNRLLDGLDGLIARRSRRSSDAGGYLDIMLDFIVYATLPLAMAWSEPALTWPVAVLLGVFYINSASWMYLSALLEKRGAGAATRGEATSVSMPKGVIEGSETIVFYTLLIVIPSWRVIVMFLFAFLTLTGALVRFVQGMTILGKRD